MTIKQHTPEWKEAKLSKVGASEIAGLVYYYCKEGLKEIGADFEPYNTALQTWAKVKFGITLPFPHSLSRWGLGMEQYIADRFNRERHDIKCVRSDDFIVIDDLAACSPDGFVSLSNDTLKVTDYDKQAIIDQSWGTGIWEAKTTSYREKDDFKNGFKWPYIFQMQYQMICCNAKIAMNKFRWGIGTVLIPKMFWEDEDFERGVILGKIESGNYNKQEIDDLFWLESFVYTQKPQLIELINTAMERFRYDLDNNIVPNVYNGSKQTLLAQEKQVLALLHPQRFGEVEADQEAEDLLGKMQEVKSDKAAALSDEAKLYNQIAATMGDAIALIGTQYKAKFDSRMALRFSKV